ARPRPDPGDAGGALRAPRLALAREPVVARGADLDVADPGVVAGDRRGPGACERSVDPAGAHLGVPADRDRSGSAPAAGECVVAADPDRRAAALSLGPGLAFGLGRVRATDLGRVRATVDGRAVRHRTGGIGPAG